MKIIEQKINQLRNQAWDLARESLELGETNIYRGLTDIVERLTKLVGNVENVNNEVITSSEMISIFAHYKGKMYEAKLDPKRIVGGRDTCVFYDGKWWTPSGSAVHITQTSVNGWLHFWKYKKGIEEVSITDLRK